MTDSEIITVLERLIHAYPDKQIGKTMLKIYVDELIDIPIHLLARAASLHIRTSPFFPRISDLRQAAQQLAGTIDFSSISPPGVDYLDLEAHQLEKDYFHHAIFDINKWEKLAAQLERVGRLCRATELREKARHIQERESAYQRGEEYPSPEARLRYAEWETHSSLS